MVPSACIIRLRAVLCVYCGMASSATLANCCGVGVSCRYRGPPLLFKQWMLQSVTGECSSDELPSHPSPSFPPEAVVEAQLAALRWGLVMELQQESWLASIQHREHTTFHVAVHVHAQSIINTVSRGG
jgi:hypothetical protein